ncbi:MAG: hypothetical protein U0575_01990 [Phycisphaerales bacterium]
MAQPGENAVALSFVRPGNDRHGGALFGWPIAWWSRTDLSRWDDAAARTGLRPLTTDPTAGPVTNPYQSVRPGAAVEPRPLWWWQDGTLWYRPAVESTGGVLRWSGLRVTGIVGSLGLVALCWGVAALTVWVINVRRARRRVAPVGPWQGRVIAAAVVVALLAMAVATYAPRDSLSTEENGALRRGPPRLPGVDLGPSARVAVAVLDEHSDDPDRDRWLAAAILTALPGAPAPGTLLAARFEPGSRMFGTRTSFNDRLQVMAVTEATYTKLDHDDPWAMRPAPEPVAVPAGTQWRFDAPYLRITRAASDAENQSTEITVDLSMVGTIALIVFGIWFVPFMIGRTVRTVVVRRRRRANGCLACGHGLSPPGM